MRYGWNGIRDTDKPSTSVTIEPCFVCSKAQHEFEMNHWATPEMIIKMSMVQHHRERWDMPAASAECEFNNVLVPQQSCHSMAF